MANPAIIKKDIKINNIKFISKFFDLILLNFILFKSSLLKVNNFLIRKEQIQQIIIIDSPIIVFTKLNTLSFIK